MIIIGENYSLAIVDTQNLAAVLPLVICDALLKIIKSFNKPVIMRDHFNIGKPRRGNIGKPHLVVHLGGKSRDKAYTFL